MRSSPSSARSASRRSATAGVLCVFARLLVLGLLAAWPATLAAQEPVPTEGSGPPTSDGEVAAGFENGVGRLSVEGRESALPYTLTLTGDLYALQPLVARLGGTLTVGPLGQSHELDLFGTKILIGPESGVMTVGDEIVPMSRTPLKELNGLMVPLDFVRRTWGEYAGYSFSWSRAERMLRVERRPSRELETSLDLVPIAGVTTLVMRFVEDPNHRFERTEDGFELVFPGDRLVLRGAMPRPAELVEEVQVFEDRVRVRLAAGAEAAEPLTLERGSRVQVLTDIARGRPQARVATPPAITRRDTSEIRIVVDPGHGGEEVGAVGGNGTLEKDLTLRLARQLQRVLEARLPVRVLLTRDRDVAVDHETRTALANQNDAALFVSLHLNSVPGGGGRGAETYFLDLEASDRDAEESARLENAAGGRDESPVELMLWDLAQSKHMQESQAFARLVQRELNEALGLRDRGVKQAPFRVLLGATMPAVLVEFGFLSNPEEEAKLQRADYQADLVRAVARAVEEFLSRRASAGRDPERAEDRP